MENYHIIKVSNVFNRRELMPMVKIESELFKQSIRIYYNNDAGSGSPSLDTGEMYLKSKGFILIGKGEGKDHYYLISSTFEPIK